MTICLLGAGCAGDKTDPQSVTATDTTAPLRYRVEAMRRDWEALRDSDADRAAFRESLKSIAWRRSEPPTLRLGAIEILADDDPDDTAAMLALMLPTETSWDIIGAVCEMGVERQWTGLTPALVRSWSRPVPRPGDDARPERAAIAALHPDRSIESVVFEVFSTPTEGRSAERARADAWALLTRIDDGGQRTRDMLLAMDEEPDDPLLGALHAGAVKLRAVPETTEQLDLLRRMRAPERREFWMQSADAIARLNDAQLQGFELRHASGVRWAAIFAPHLLEASREELLSDARRALDGVRPYHRTVDHADVMAAPKETLDEWHDHLSYGDLLLIIIAKKAIEDPYVVEQLFEQADADRRDGSTEYGGVLDAVWPSDAGADRSTIATPRFDALLFPPRPNQRHGPNRFVASPELLDRGTDALFHYHFHAQRHNNRDYAGPGQGDFEYARRFGRSCLVFTFINRNTLNADYFQPNGATIDLGVITR
ncbi:MAG: hypothetical protein EA376_08080 [Phycisphaeraceae bacterium]|nr:MAG: hypothetical protein EA376_08080 [Phycisphaeraceae bacterium]